MFAEFDCDRTEQAKWRSPTVCVPVAIVTSAQCRDGIDEQKFTRTTTPRPAVIGAARVWRTGGTSLEPKRVSGRA